MKKIFVVLLFALTFFSNSKGTKPTPTNDSELELCIATALFSGEKIHNVAYLLNPSLAIIKNYLNYQSETGYQECFDIMALNLISNLLDKCQCPDEKLTVLLFVKDLVATINEGKPYSRLREQIFTLALDNVKMSIASMITEEFSGEENWQIEICILDMCEWLLHYGFCESFIKELLLHLIHEYSKNEFTKRRAKEILGFHGIDCKSGLALILE